MTDTEVIPHTTEVLIVKYQGVKLVMAREAAGLSQAELARRAGMKQQHISKYERDGIHRVTKEVFDRLMGAIKKPH